MQLSVIVPVLDEAAGVVGLLDSLAPLRARGHQVLVVDGGSRDDTVALAEPRCDGVVHARRGRATQMNTGARGATGDVILFLHADTRLPHDADRLIEEALAPPGREWGRFDVTIEGTSRWLPVVATMMNGRSRLTGISTGDQAFFVRRATFERVGGFPRVELMEDIALSRRLKRESRPVCLRARVITSGRRWERNGVWRTILLMWRLRLLYFFGASPERLARSYYRRG